MHQPSLREPMLEMFLYETLQLIAGLEQTVLTIEDSGRLDNSSVNEIFRIMHTIKGSASMMMFDNISSLAHSVEDLFHFIRKENPVKIDLTPVCDMILSSIDFIKTEINKIQEGMQPDADPGDLIHNINTLLLGLKQENLDSSVSNPNDDSLEQRFYIGAAKVQPKTTNARYKAVVWFEDDCNMENIRAFNIMRKLQGMAEAVIHYPADILENSATVDIIQEHGFEVKFRTDKSVDEIVAFITNADLVKNVIVNAIDDEPRQIILEDHEEDPVADPGRITHRLSSGPRGIQQNVISVNVDKLDFLMDLVGELVISEAMVTHHPEISAMYNMPSFVKAARQHRKIINEVQDMVMSIRMVPLQVTFQKMRRIVRDMSHKLHKEVELEIIGEETEVDKNIIDHLSGPIMHLIRNAIDHGIESREERIAAEKPPCGRIKLEARNEGGDVWISIKDDGAGLNKEKILKRVVEMKLLDKPLQDMSDREIFAFILMPGFSTRDEISEFSGRGVGMDVVAENIGMLGGEVQVDSTPGIGTTVALKIPLTLAIINGMLVQVGRSVFIISTKSIKETLRPDKANIINDPEGEEMLMIRGDCLPILRLRNRFGLAFGKEQIDEGIIIVIENDGKRLCLFADALLGEQQVVVKAMPKYLKKINGISGCTLLGDGSASLIIDTARLTSELGS